MTCWPSLLQIGRMFTLSDVIRNALPTGQVTNPNVGLAAFGILSFYGDAFIVGRKSRI